MGNHKQQRVGLFGGTFDPIHFGHLRAAEEIKQILELDKVYFIPTAISPHKADTNVTPSSKRLEMLKLAIEGNKYFDISEFELESESPSYTVLTLEHFNEMDPTSELYFIVGNEQFDQIETWRDYKRLFDLANFAVITRPGFSELDSNRVPLALKDDFRYYNSIENVISYTIKSKEIVFIEIKGIEISSTDIRAFVKSKKSIKYLVPNKVQNYILSEKLYDEEALK
jgi:nicotinate-nucleotide adenylyltransferase